MTGQARTSNRIYPRLVCSRNLRQSSQLLRSPATTLGYSERGAAGGAGASGARPVQPVDVLQFVSISTALDRDNARRLCADKYSDHFLIRSREKLFEIEAWRVSSSAGRRVGYGGEAALIRSATPTAPPGTNPHGLTAHRRCPS
jgi:hypothetical protein